MVYYWFIAKSRGGFLLFDFHIVCIFDFHNCKCMKTKPDVNLLKNFISEHDFSQTESIVVQAMKTLLEKSGAGSNFTGWVNLPSELLGSKTLLEKIKNTQQRIGKMQPDTIVVIGIGGSYLGTKAIYGALSPAFPDNSKPQLIFAGHQLDSGYHQQLIAFLRNRNPVVVAISKSGTTTEPAIAFRMVRALMEEKYGNEAAQRIVAVTDASKGALRSLCENKGYDSFVIPDDIGGRFSVLSPVGLLPIALCGFSIDQLLEGAAEAEKELTQNFTIKTNAAMLYAAARNILLEKGKSIELLATFHPQLATLSEWWKKLFGESEGKNGKGLFPASLVFSTDLHSLGQYVQDGSRILFETFISVEKPSSDIEIPTLHNDDDGLLYLEGKLMSFVNQKACEATQLAHVDGNVPVLTLNIPYIDEYSIGELLYFFEFSCALSAYSLGVNPFDQPGVEAYKQNMYRLLGKPGF